MPLALKPLPEASLNTRSANIAIVHCGYQALLEPRIDSQDWFGSYGAIYTASRDAAATKSYRAKKAAEPDRQQWFRKLVLIQKQFDARLGILAKEPPMDMASNLPRSSKPQALYRKLPKRLRASISRLRGKTKDNPDGFLFTTNGVIHIGANLGQERLCYALHELHVIWIEPIPEVFAQLQENIKSFSNQIAYECLLSDQDDIEYQFNIADNNGASSSILDFGLHAHVWPEVKYARAISIKSKTLPRLVRDMNIDISKYDAMVLDTQGSELLILKGAGPLLSHFKYIKTEVSDFEAYKDCCTLTEMTGFLEGLGFYEESRKLIMRSEEGCYLDVVYKNKHSQ